jgi:hypothetical protein
MTNDIKRHEGENIDDDGRERAKNHFSFFALPADSSPKKQTSVFMGYCSTPNGQYPLVDGRPNKPYSSGYTLSETLTIPWNPVDVSESCFCLSRKTDRNEMPYFDGL